jgi:hypothetical protein
MVDPISNQQFSHDYQKFVFQELSALPLQPYGTPKIPFFLPSVKKTKKDIEKEANPFGLIKHKKDEDKKKNKEGDEKEGEEDKEGDENKDKIEKDKEVLYNFY